MRFEDNIIFNTYSNDANKSFREVQGDLSKLEENFNDRMNGKNTGDIVGSLLGILLWVCATGVGIYMLLYKYSAFVDRYIVFAGAGIILLLLLFMSIDKILDLSYYGKITAFRQSLSLLQERVRRGQNSIDSDYKKFISFKEKGWDHSFRVADSIPDEADNIAKQIKGMVSLKKGFLNKAKDFLYYTAGIVVTVAGSIALYPVSSNIITRITNMIWSIQFSNDELNVFNTIGMVLTLIIEILVAKSIWTKTNCEVTNVSLISIPVGVGLFLAIVAVVTALVNLIAGIIYIVVMIAATIFLLAVVAASASGG